MSDSEYIQAARKVLREGGFKIRPTHNGFEIREGYFGRTLHTLPCRETAEAEAGRMNERLRLVVDNERGTL